MKVAKRFRWEGAHRLPWHEDGCQNLHGHSYCMWVELKGEIDEQGMLIDFKVIKDILTPLLKAWDHATIVAETDKQLLDALRLLKSKHYIIPYDTTSENLCRYVSNYILEHALTILNECGVSAVTIKLQETETCFAEHEITIGQAIKIMDNNAVRTVSALERSHDVLKTF